MSVTISHGFVHPGVDSPDAGITEAGPTQWNNPHVFTGGAAGNLIFRDTGDSTGADWAATMFWDESNSRLGIGTAIFTDPFTLLELRSSTSGTSLANLLTLTKNTSGTPAIGMGPGIFFRGESSTTESQDMAAIYAIWETVTHASRSAGIAFYTVSAAGALAERMRLTAAGSLVIGTSESTITGSPVRLACFFPGAAGALAIWRDTTNDTESIYGVDSSGALLGTVSNHAVNFRSNNTVRMTLGAGGGLVIGSPTGGNKGDGTLNATAVYDDNVLLTDHLFDLAYDGVMKPEDQAKYPDERLWSMAETKAFTETRRHLPWLPGRSEWEATGSRSVGQMTTSLWKSVEHLALLLFAIDARLDALESAWKK